MIGAGRPAILRMTPCINGKQTILILSNDSRAHVMYYPQQPLAQTHPYKLLGFAERFIHRGADAWFLKGENVESELKDAGKAWQFEVDQYESISDPRGRVIHIRRLRHAR